MVIKKSLAILTVIVAMFTVACETDEDPGTDLGDGGVTTIAPPGDTGAPAPGGTDTTLGG